MQVRFIHVGACGYEPPMLVAADYFIASAHHDIFSSRGLLGVLTCESPMVFVNGSSFDGLGSFNLGAIRINMAVIFLSTHLGAFV